MSNQDFDHLIEAAGASTSGLVGLKSLTDPDVVAMFEYWKSKRNGRLMPRPEDMNPSEFAPYMPNIMTLQVHWEPFDLTYRLLGEEVITVHGFSLKGKSVREANSKRTGFGDMLFELYRQVALQRRPYGVGGTLEFLGRGHMSFEGVYMPLSHDGARTDRLITCTSYHADGGS